MNILKVRVDARGQYTGDGNWWGPDTANQYPFETSVPIEYNGNWWKQRYIPFSMLGCWACNTDPFHYPTAADLKSVKLLAFSLKNDDGKSADTTASHFYMDGIELYNKTAASEIKVYAGVKAMSDHISSSIMPMTFDDKVESHTYDNALAAMTFILHGDQARAQQLFSIYKTIHDANWGAEPGFYYAYFPWGAKMQADAAGALGRGAGPNAYMLLALLYYKKVFPGDNTYNAMIDDLGIWIASLQQPDGHVNWGYTYAGVVRGEGSTEVNADCYAALWNYGAYKVNPLYQTKADAIKTWINTMWIPAEKRFKVGDSVAAIDKSLDCYSVPVAALTHRWKAGDPAYWSCLTDATNGTVVMFKNTQYCLYSGQMMDGFDFGGAYGVNPDKDGIWFEGSGQMVVAFNASTDTINAPPEPRRLLIPLLSIRRQARDRRLMAPGRCR